VFRGQAQHAAATAAIKHRRDLGEGAKQLLVRRLVQQEREQREQQQQGNDAVHQVTMTAHSRGAAGR
jgi:hypothetical protein